MRFSIVDFSECWKSEAKAADTSYYGVQGGRWDMERLVAGSGPKPGGRARSLVYEVLVMVVGEIGCEGVECSPSCGTAWRLIQ